MPKSGYGKFKMPMKLEGHAYDNGFQTWVKRIYLYDDQGLEKVGDVSIGFYHCTHCGAWKGWAYKLPPKDAADGENKRAHNEFLDFLFAHSHGDGRAILFERKHAIRERASDASEVKV